MTISIVESYKDRVVELGDKVDTYRNLTKGCISLRIKGLVYGYADAIHLSEALFKVGESGNKAVRHQKQKNVHAFVQGRLEGASIHLDSVEAEYERLKREGYERVYYNPYRVTSFVLFDTLEPVYQADEAVVVMDRVYIKNHPKAS